MKKPPKFNHDFIVFFNRDEFQMNNKRYKITGVTGIDLDKNKIQMREDLTVLENGKFMSFARICFHWDKIEKILLKIANKKTLIRRI